MCAAVIEAGRKPGEVIAIVARNGPGVVVASYGVMSSGAAEFVVDLNLGPDDIAYAMQIIGVRLAVVERGELERVVPLGLEVLVLEDIPDASPRRRGPAVRSARLGQDDHDLGHHRPPEGDRASP